MHVKDILSANFKIINWALFYPLAELWAQKCSGFSQLTSSIGAIPIVAQPKSEQDKTALQEQQQRELELILPKPLNSFNPTLQSVGKRILDNHISPARVQITGAKTKKGIALGIDSLLGI